MPEAGTENDQKMAIFGRFRGVCEKSRYGVFEPKTAQKTLWHTVVAKHEKSLKIMRFPSKSSNLLKSDEDFDEILRSEHEP